MSNIYSQEEYIHYLEDIAYKDNLTKICNRNGLYKKLAINNQLNYSVILLDLDNFKTINDTLGHNIGDIVLVKIALIIEELTSDIDIVCRWGGDEFCVLTPDINEERVSHLASLIKIRIEQLSKSIEDLYSNYKAVPNKLGVSIGISNYNSSLGKTKYNLEKDFRKYNEYFSDLEEAIQQADEKMYLEKNSNKQLIILPKYP